MQAFCRRAIISLLMAQAVASGPALASEAVSMSKMPPLVDVSHVSAKVGEPDAPAPPPLLSDDEVENDHVPDEHVRTEQRVAPTDNPPQDETKARQTERGLRLAALIGPGGRLRNRTNSPTTDDRISDFPKV